MRNLRYSATAAVILAAAVTASVAVHAEQADFTQIEVDYTRFQLDNGLTVLVRPDHSTPTVFVGMWYGVGSKDEPEGMTGFAHLFEHLMFQGTANREGEFFSPFSDAGATGMNGTTSQDRTNYFATVPSGALDMALWMESDRMIHLLGAVTQEALDEQRGVVLNEKREGETRPYGQVPDKLRAGVYPLDHPYRHSVIGSMDDLNAATLDDVHEWFNTYYGATNAVLVLVGDVTVEDARARVEKYFGGAPAGKPLSRPRKWIPDIPEIRREIMYDHVGQARVLRAWALPDRNDRDMPLLYLANETLVGNRNSPLYRKLVDELRLVTGVSGSVIAKVMNGDYFLDIALAPGTDPEEAAAIVDETLSEYFATGPDENILENAKLAINISMLSVLETGSGIGTTLAEGELYSGDPLHVNKELRSLNAASAEEVRAVAERWLSRGYYQLTVLPFPDYPASEDAVDRSRIPPVTAAGGINFPPIETTALENGLELVVARRGGIPLVDVTIDIRTGRMADAPDAPGLSTLMTGLVNRGTKTHSVNELAAAADGIALNFSCGGGIERSSCSYRILRAYLGESLELAAEMLRDASFPQEEVNKVVDQLSAALANLENAPANAAGDLFNRVVFGADHPLGGVWTPELLQRVDRNAIVDFHRDEVAPDNMTVYIIGDIELDEARTLVEDAFGNWAGTAQSAMKPVGEALEPRARVILVDYPGAASSTIVAGHALEPYDAETWDELSIMNAAFGGTFESRLNMNLREDKGWSYGYRSRVSRVSDGDMFVVASGSVQVDKTMESMVEIRREFEDYASSHPATDEEVGRIKLNRTRSLPGSFTTNRDFLASIVQSDRFGLPLDYAEGVAGRIAMVTPGGVRERAQHLLDPEILTWVVVGDLERIEAPVRSLGYGEVEVWDAFGRRMR